MLAHVFSRSLFPIACLFILGVSFLFSSQTDVYAQNQSFDIVTSYKIEGNTTIGDIVSRVLPENVLKPSSRQSNESIVGVVISEDAAIVTYRGGDDEQLIAQRGVHRVNVSNFNGDIFPGDFITTSPIPGKGQRASNISENILGLAIEDFNASVGTPIQVEGAEGVEVRTGSILVDLNTKPNAQNLGAFKDILNLASRFGITLLSQMQTDQGSSQFIRYFLASVVTILTVYFSFRHFGLAILRGIEAIGRNPLARAHIQSAIIINGIIIVFVSLSVVVLSLFIIRL